MINRILNPVTDTDTGYEIDMSQFEVVAPQDQVDN